MVAVQLIVLKIALDHRPPPTSKGGDAATPFAGAHDGLFEKPRPYSFWQWRSPKPCVLIPKCSSRIKLTFPQILAIPAIPLHNPNHQRARPRAIPLAVPSLLLADRLHRTLGRGNPASTPNIRQCAVAVLQGVPVVCACELAPGRRDEDVLVLHVAY
jgi:hypothetical protein